MTLMLPNTTFDELHTRFKNLCLRLQEAEVILRDIGNGKRDGKPVLSQLRTEHACRLLVETMNDGTATLASDGTILYSNKRLAAMLQVPTESPFGTLSSFIASADHAVLRPAFIICLFRKILKMKCRS